MQKPYIVMVEFEQDNVHHMHIFHSVYAKSKGDALNLVQGFMDLNYENIRIKKLSTCDHTRIRDYDAIRPVNPYYGD